MAITLMGNSEIAAALGISRQRAAELSRRQGFPQPLARLAMGPVWDRRDIAKWAKRDGRTLKPHPRTRR